MHPVIFAPLIVRMLKIGVFGVGHLGKFHLNNWKEIKEVEVVGFYATLLMMLHRMLLEKYQIPRFLSMLNGWLMPLMLLML